jgi:hypothetical protein
MFRKLLLIPILAVLTGSLATPSVAVAQVVRTGKSETQAGTFVLKNTSGREVKLEDIKYTDASSEEVSLSGYYSIKGDFYGRLLHKDVPISASKLQAKLTTSAGTTTITWTSRGTDQQGQFVCLLTESDITEHRKLLGLPPLKPLGPSEDDIKRGVVKALGAALSHAGYRKIIDDPDANLAQLIVAEGLRVARDEIINSAITDFFPQLSSSDASTVSTLVILALDGKLTKANIAEAKAKEEIIASLKKNNPDMAAVVQVADFLYRVQSNRR